MVLDGGVATLLISRLGRIATHGRPNHHFGTGKEGLASYFGTGQVLSEFGLGMDTPYMSMGPYLSTGGGRPTNSMSPRKVRFARN